MDQGGLLGICLCTHLGWEPVGRESSMDVFKLYVEYSLSFLEEVLCEKETKEEHFGNPCIYRPANEDLMNQNEDTQLRVKHGGGSIKLWK